jgi:hypothetical protein
VRVEGEASSVTNTPTRSLSLDQRDDDDVSEQGGPTTDVKSELNLVHREAHLEDNASNAPTPVGDASTGLTDDDSPTSSDLSSEDPMDED